MPFDCSRSIEINCHPATPLDRLIQTKGEEATTVGPAWWDEWVPLERRMRVRKVYTHFGEFCTRSLLSDLHNGITKAKGREMG